MGKPKGGKPSGGGAGPGGGGHGKPDKKKTVDAAALGLGGATPAPSMLPLSAGANPNPVGGMNPNMLSMMAMAGALGNGSQNVNVAFSQQQLVQMTHACRTLASHAPILSTCDAPSKFQAQVSATGPPRVGPILGFQAHERMLTNQLTYRSTSLTGDSHLTNDHAHASGFHL